MRIAIATSDEQKDWYKDIALLTAALENNGHTSDIVFWDNPQADWERYDVVFIDSTWNYTEKLERFLVWCKSVSNTCTLVNDLSVIKLSSNKHYLLTLQEAGLNIPPTTIVQKATTVTDTVLERHPHRVVVKPLVGANGVNAALFNSIQDAIAATASRGVFEETVVVQDYMSEIETLGELGAIFISGQLSHCVLKKPSGKDFRVQHQYGGSTELTHAPVYTQDLYRLAVNALGVKPAYARLDFIPADNPTIMEIEMVEPNKYLSLYPQSAEQLAKALAG